MSTNDEVPGGLDDISLSIHRVGTAGTHLAEVRSIYAAVYAEPPYCETAHDVDDFVATWLSLASGMGPPRCHDLGTTWVWM
jgi:hypothetical protein